MADYTIQRHFPDYAADNRPYLNFLNEVIKGQAQLIGKWQLVGFIQGVMNTDNMVLSGETIDYGPCAFMDIYDPEIVFSSIDRNGRYAYRNQPLIGAWNLARFAETLLPLLHEEPEEATNIANKAISNFEPIFLREYLKGMRAKLGLFGEKPEDESIIVDLLKIMENNKADYTNTFRSLTLNNLNDMDVFKTDEFKEWHNRWISRKDKQEESREESFELMKSNNPSVIPRNHRVEEALEAAFSGNYNVMENLLRVLSDPYSYSPEHDIYTSLPPASSCSYRTFCGT